jgi:small subunit ribosomal protein S21
MTLEFKKPCWNARLEPNQVDTGRLLEPLIQRRRTLPGAGPVASSIDRHRARPERATKRRSGARKFMPVIKVKDNESFEQAMKRFKKTVEKAGTLTELRRREYYDKPSIRKKKKAAAARKRALKKMRRMAN